MDERRKSRDMRVEEAFFTEHLVYHAKERCDSSPHAEGAGGEGNAIQMVGRRVW